MYKTSKLACSQHCCVEQRHFHDVGQLSNCLGMPDEALSQQHRSLAQYGGKLGACHWQEELQGLHALG